MKNIVKSIAIKTDEGRQFLNQAKLIVGFGIENDQNHDEIRQISIVSDKFIVNNNTNQIGFCHKKFKENLIIMNLQVNSLDKLDKISIGSSIVELTQVYKKCHDKCPRLKLDEKCEVNKEVVFAKVLKSGYIKVDDFAIKL